MISYASHVQVAARVRHTHADLSTRSNPNFARRDQICSKCRSSFRYIRRMVPLSSPQHLSSLRVYQWIRVLTSLMASVCHRL